MTHCVIRGVPTFVFQYPICMYMKEANSNTQIFKSVVLLKLAHARKENKRMTAHDLEVTAMCQQL